MTTSDSIQIKNDRPSSSTRQKDYTPQQGVRAVLSLANFEDKELFAELRRRGFTGELRYSKVVSI